MHQCNRRADFDALCDLVFEGALTLDQLLDAGIIKQSEFDYIKESCRMITELDEIGYGDDAEEVFLDSAFGGKALEDYYRSTMAAHALPVTSDGDTLQAIGERLGLSKEMVRQVQDKAFAKIRERFAHAQEFVQEQHAGPTWLPAGSFC